MWRGCRQKGHPTLPSDGHRRSRLSSGRWDSHRKVAGSNPRADKVGCLQESPQRPDPAHVHRSCGYQATSTCRPTAPQPSPRALT
ncbi:uncharacterized protein [Salvelinus alpinus]|uniref:uncharacterized protein isoform X4 n=1 Tax=Salvelinus alpinus TaxID=8036 RepID=UPI0039FCC241